MQEQENNNFETIISTWRRLSGDQGEPSVLESMSGDSRSFQPSKKKEEKSNLMILERPKGPIATAASAGAVVTAVDATQTDKPDNTIGVSTEDKEKPEPEKFIKHDKEETKEAAGDANYSKDKEDNGYLDNDSFIGKTADDSEKTILGKGDNVDSVYLRPPPPHKMRSTASTQDDEDCGFKCLYYTLQCCDCVLM